MGAGEVQGWWIQRCSFLTRRSGCLRRTLLAREQRRMRGEYEIRLRELERERIHAEQDKAQVRI